MSTTVDSRVVEMRFDNQHFEKNVQTSLSTLDKLKQKLNLTGASKGLEDINAAARNNNFGVLGSAVQTVGHKFSALQVMGVTALANITNSAVNTGKRMVKALTIDPVRTGWNEYELKMGSIQTIMASTGESLATVNKYLNELNEYSDKTIYSFSDMTQNIGKFTNAGVKLEDAVMAIKGISNEAALSGANANEASRAMYNFAQALSAGYVKLIDWKSIENANMATVGFKEQLIQSAVAAGTLTKVGDGMYKTLTGKTVSATKNFNESLQEQWMTTEVLVGTLKDYADETTDIGKKATKAATEVKTFSQMMDALKESAQSGWAQTWEIIFGDFEQGKTLWTNINKVVDGLIGKMTKLRNDALRSAFSSPWEKLNTKINEAGINTEDFKDKLLQTAKKHGKVTDQMLKDEKAFDKCLEDGVFSRKIVIETLQDYANASKKTGESTEDMTAKLKKFQEVVNDVWRGDYKNGKERIDALTKAGYNYAEVQALVNKTVNGHKLTLKDLSDAQLKSVGYTDKQIKAIRELAAEAEKSGSSLNELIADISKPSGRTLFFDSFANIWGEFSKILEEIGSAWKEVFGEADAGDMLYNVIDGIHKFTESLNISEDAAANFHSVVKGIFSLMDLSWSLASASFMGGLKIVNEILKLFGTDLLKVLGLIGDKISEFNEWVEGIAFVGSNTKWKDFAQVFVAIYEGVSKCVKSFSELKGVQAIIKSVTKWASKFAGVFSKGFEGIKIENIVKSIEDFFNKIDKWIKGLDKSEMFNAGLDIVKGLASGISSGVGTVLDVLEGLATRLVEWFKSLLGIHSPSTVFMSLGKYIIAGLVLGLSMGYAGAGKTIKAFATDLIAKGGEMTKGFIDGIQNGFDKTKDFLSPIIKKFAEVFGEIDFGSVLAATVGISMLSFFKTLSGGIDKVGDALGILAKPIGGLGKILENIASGISTLTIGFANMQKAFSTNIKSKTLKNLAISIAILVGALIALSLIVKKNGIDELWQAVGLIAALAGIMFVLAGATALMSNASVQLSKTGLSLKGLNVGLIGMAATLLILAGTVKILGKMSPDEIKRGFLGLAGAIVAMMAVMGMLAGMSLIAKEADVAKIGGIFIKLSIALLLLIAAVKIIANLSEDEMDKGARVISAFAGMVMLLIASTRLAGPGIESVGNMMLKISVALLMMVGVAKLIAGMTWGEMGKAAVGILGFVGIIALLTLITNLNTKYINNLGNTMLQISGALVFLAITVKLLGDMEWSKMGKAAVGLLGLVGVIAILVAITRLAGDKAPKIALTLLAMSISIGILAAVAMVLGLVKLENLAKGIIAVGLLGGVMAGIIHASKGAGDIKGTMIGIAVAIGVMAASLAILSFIKWEKLLPATIALTAVMLALGTIVGYAHNLGKDATVPLIVLTVIIGLLAFIIHKLAELPIESSLSASASLSMLMLSLSTSMKILKQTSGLDVKTYASIGILALVMAALAGILYLIQGMPVASTLANTVALSTLLLAMVAAVKILSTIPNVSKEAFGAVVVMTLVMAALAGILYLIQDMPVASTIANAKALSTLLLSLSAACVILGVVGLFKSAAFVGIAALMTLIVGMGALMVGIGALVDKFPKLETFIDKCIPILEKIGTGLGAFFGGIVGGFAEGVTSSLPGIASDLSLFMLNLTPFITGARMIDESAMTGIKNITKMIALISGAKILDGLSTMFGGTSMEELSANLVSFGEAIVDFSSIVKGNVDEESVTAAMNAAKMFAEIQALTTLTDVISIFTGASGLDTFGEQLESFGGALVGFSKTVSADGAINPSAIEAAASAGELMAELQNSVAPGLGVVTLFTGQKNLEQFGEQLKAFGEAIVNFSDAVSAGNGIDVKAVEAAKNAGLLMTELQTALPKTNGIAQIFSGEQNLTNFGAQLIAFGEAIVGFSDTVSGENTIDATAIESAKNAGLIMTELQTALPKTNGIAQIFSGQQSLTDFGAQLTAFGEAVVGFSDTVSEGGVSVEAITAAKNAGDLMVTLQNSIPDDKWFDGKVSLSDFGKTMKKFGEYIADYSTEVADINGEAITKSIDTTKQIVNITRTLGTIKPENIDNFNAEKLGEALKDYADNVADIDQTAVTNSVSATRKIISLINSLANLDTSGVSSFKSAVSSLAQTNINGLAKSFSSSAKQLSSVGGDLASNIAKGMSSKSGALNGAAKSIVGGLSSQLASASGNFSKTGSDIMLKLASGIKAATSKVTSAIKTPIAKGVSTARLYYSNFYNAGEYLVKGFASGISANTWRAEAKAKAMANAAERAAKKALDEHSPSRVFYKIGDYAGLGFVNALSDHASTAYSASTVMADSARQGLSDAMSKVNDILSGDMDVQPTIRPVLDLSDVRSGAGAINGLLGNGVTLGAMANVNAIGSMMNQNGKGDDVVSAINRLRKNLGNLGNTTYNVNGITYDDGSNVSNAVKDIIRYTRIEGRV